MKTKNIALILLTTFMVGVGTYTIAQQHEHAKKERREHHHKKGQHRMLSEIPDLTDKQKEQIKEIQMKKAKQIIPIKNELGEKKARMKTLMSADKPQKEEIMNLVEEMGRLKTQMKKIKITSKLDIHNILTEEQRLWIQMHKVHGAHAIKHH